MSVGRRICLGAEQELRGDLFVVIVSACQVISTAKGLAEGAEDGVGDTLCGSVCIGPYGDEYCRLNRTMNADFPPPEKNCIQVHANFPRRRKVRVHK